MTDDLLKQMIAEMVSIRRLLAAVLHQQQVEGELAEIRTELDQVEAQGQDMVQYLKQRSKVANACNKKPRAH